MKKILFNIIMLSLLLLLLANCGNRKGPDLSPGASKKILKNLPNWYLEPPFKEGFRYETSTATSQDIQMAVNKASLDASNKLAGQVKSEMNGLIKRVQEETGLGEDSHVIDQFSQMQEQVIATALEDWKITKKEIQEEKSNTGRIYRAYVLLEWDEGAAQKRFLSKLKSNEQIYTAIRATELYEEMEAKVEKYRERYGN
jgi:hypothetical protein